MCSGSFQGQKKKICFIVVPLLVEEEGGNVGGRGEDRLVFMEIIFLCLWEEIHWIYSVAPQKTYSSIFGCPNPSCPRHCYIYCKFGNNLLLTIYCKFDEQLLVLWWWTQVSNNAHPCNWLLLHISPRWNWYLACWESHDIFPVFDPRQSHASLPHLAPSWCSSGRLFMAADHDQVLNMALFLQGQSGYGADIARMGKQ